MWVTSEPLIKEEAEKELRKAVKDLDEYIRKGQIEILDYSQWYTKAGKFGADRVLEGWVEKEKKALEKGFSGLRLTGNTSWLEKNNWESFSDYEHTVNSVIEKYKMIAICSYSLGKCKASDIIDIASSHQYALIGKDGKLQIFESSKRKKAEEKLKESEEKFRNLSEEISDGISVTIDGKNHWVNKAFCDIFGYTKEEFIGKGADLVIIPEEFPLLIERMKARLSGKGVVSHYETIAKRKDGKRINVDVSAKVIMFEGKRAIQIVARDITERKKTEEKLRESEEKFKELTELLPEAVFEIDLKGRFTFANKKALEISGYSLEELNRGADAFQMMAPEERDRLSKNMRLVLDGKDIGTNEYTAIKKNGTRFPVLIHSSIIMKDSKPAGLRGIIVDISGKKKSEQTLRESEEKFRNLFNLSPNVNAITTFGEGLILDVNKAFEDELGIPREKVIGKKASDLDFIDSKTRKDAYAKLEKDGFSVVEVEGIVKGQKRFGRIFAKVIELNGKKYIFQSIIDLTEQKLAEERLIEDERRLKESLALAARQNIQLSRMIKEKIKMQEKLHEYAKQLEIKVKTLENKIPLTNKEKIVLYGIAAWPMLNDLELSAKLKLKRSTVTAIKNRLREEKWFFTLMVPNFYALGCEISSLIHCNFNTNLKERKNLGITDEILNRPEIVFFGEEDNKSIGLFVSKNFISIKKYLDDSLMIRQNVLNKEMDILSFFSELSMVKKPDFSGILNELFDLHFPKIKKELFDTKNNLENLNKNERRVLCALVEFPEYSIAEISKKVWLSKPTVSTIKKKLIAENFLFPLVIPNLNNLPLDLGLIMSSKFDPLISKKVSFLEKDIEKLERSTVLKIIGNNEITSLMLFRNKEECDEELAKIREFCRKNNTMPAAVKTIFFPIKGKSMSAKLDFSSLTKKLVFPESF
jgi:PAS domain S-box-containing protein